MNKIVVYTSNFGGKDNLREIEHYPGVDYVYFTDDKSLKSKTWKIRQIEPDPFKSFRMQARIYKILPHLYFPEYQYSVWVDGRILPIKNFFPILGNMGEYTISLFNHGRNCIYKEAKACIKKKKDSPEIIRKHMERYLTENYPKDNGLTATGVIFRKHNNPKLIKAMEIWWNELNIGSSRDQLSFCYAMWKADLEYQMFEALVIKNSFFQMYPHLRKSSTRDIK